MKKNLIVLSILTILYSCNSNRVDISVKNGIQINGATIVTYDNSGNLKEFRGNIVIDSGDIVYVGEEKPKVNGECTTINGNNKYVIPGLIDSHVHLANVAGMNFRQQKKYPDLVEGYFEQLPRSFLFHGYTTLVDLNNYAPQRIDKILKEKIRPDIYTCGEMISVMNDFTMEMEEYPQEVRLKLPFVHDHYNEHVHIPDSIDLKPHSVSSIVKNIIEDQNGICIKALYEDASSGLKETWQKPSTGILSDIAGEARAFGIVSIIHAPSMEGQQAALKAGMDIIAHGMWNWSSDPLKITQTDFSVDHKKLLDEIVEAKIGYQPTYRAITSEIDVLSGNFLTDTSLVNVLPRPYIDWLKTDEGNWFLKRMLNRPNYLKKTNPEFFEKVRSQFVSDSAMRDSIYTVLKTRIDKVTRYLADNDANLLFGTDFGVMNIYTSPPGYSGFLEMNHWAEAGVSLEVIFKAATYNNAKALDLDYLYGSIVSGKIANLLILDSNPLEDIQAYNDIDSIVLHGEIISRKSLLANQ
ncbi:amidohydrolase family protein [Allomuricauda sp. SCSIO 65647]|uniref:amidohydrolase family protein n=1 Tax=Allomuricauda sp. SCSIO 65647 TaxID=2908843 RepID=UPI001F370622|nr:amidohydrolase family protein [Muricauda sp. SCSIO 65647]UJH66789.1 amidohydrolase family protein [Muricauda sp. SCSIO 65647]